MRLSGQNVLHSGAVQWYYEIVAGHGPGVPEAIIRHIRQCWVCRKQIHRLKEAVTGAGPRPVESLGSTELTEVRVERRAQSSRGAWPPVIQAPAPDQAIAIRTNLCATAAVRRAIHGAVVLHGRGCRPALGRGSQPADRAGGHAQPG